MKTFFGLILSALIFSMLINLFTLFHVLFYSTALCQMVNTTTFTLVSVYILVWLYKRKQRRKRYEQRNGLYSQN